MREQILKNLFTDSSTKRYGVVIKQISGDRYKVRDSLGRITEADSDITWAVGSGVKIKDNLIVGKASNITVLKRYQV